MAEIEKKRLAKEAAERKKREAEEAKEREDARKKQLAEKRYLLHGSATVRYAFHQEDVMIGPVLVLSSGRQKERHEYKTKRS